MRDKCFWKVPYEGFGLSRKMYVSEGFKPLKISVHKVS
jgi:hypothetical protein